MCQFSSLPLDCISVICDKLDDAADVYWLLSTCKKSYVLMMCESFKVSYVVQKMQPQEWLRYTLGGSCTLTIDIGYTKFEGSTGDGITYEGSVKLTQDFYISMSRRWSGFIDLACKNKGIPRNEAVLYAAHITIGGKKTEEDIQCVLPQSSLFAVFVQTILVAQRFCFSRTKNAIIEWYISMHKDSCTTGWADIFHCIHSYAM